MVVDSYAVFKCTRIAGFRSHTSVIFLEIEDGVSFRFASTWVRLSVSYVREVECEKRHST